MLATAIIVFREVLEAALIVGIVLAASRGIAYRGAWIAGGIAAGVIGAMLVAAGAETIAVGRRGDGSGGVQRRDPARRGRDARLAQYLDDDAWPRDGGRRQSPGVGGARGRAPALGAGAGGRAGGAARGVRGRSVPVRHRGERRRRGRHGAGRRARRSGRGDGRGGALLRAGQHPAASSVRGHRLDDFAAGRRHGGAGRRVSGAGRSAAVARQSVVGHLVRC